mgnify:CR=1 FL=1
MLWRLNWGRRCSMSTGLPPGGAFRHPADYKTRFASDELYYVLCGELALANPETGEVHLAQRDQAIFFRRDTWHHGFSVGPDALRVLEILAPPPSKGSCGEYALELSGGATVEIFNV